MHWSEINLILLSCLVILVLSYKILNKEMLRRPDVFACCHFVFLFVRSVLTPGFNNISGVLGQIY